MVTENTTQSDGSTSFLRAARAGNLDRVLEHLKNNIDINTSNANGLNALHLASKDGHVHVASELLRRGAIVDSATKKGNTALHIASLAGQEEIVKLLLQHNASVNVQSQNGFTPLYMAAQENHDSVVKLLLANGANQSLATEDGFTPLAVAMQQGHDKVVAVLLESDTRGKVRLPALHIAAKKDDVKAATLLLDNDHNPDVTSKSGFTPLHIASHYGNQSIANLLIQKGADVNFSAKHNISPLHVAAKWGKTNMVSLLLEKGANIEAKTRDGLTPLHCAARSGHEQVVDMLLERGAPISAKTKNGLAALHMAAQGEHVDAARILLYHRAPVDEVTIDYLTALHVAAHCGHVRVAKLLLDRNADANSRALNGFTPLHIACKKNRIKVVELLLRHGASIGATTESGLTPLHVAAFMGCMNIVIYLLQHDASPDVPTVRGETPLHLAARANQTDIIRILLRNGAQVDARAREQQTPLHIASRLGNVDIVMLLLQHGAQVDATTKDMYTALHISAKEGQDEVAAVLIDNGASLEATTKKGFTSLHLAAKYGHAKVAQLLLQKEADVDAQGKNGVTPLHVACHYDKQNVALMLLEKGASPHAIAKNGHTPLHIAARKNQMDIATTLLEYGAQANAESKAGFTPLHLSSQEGHIEISNLLIEHKASVNHPAKNGLTPTHLCAQEDNVDMADILLRNGANIDMATKAGYTPLHIACHFGQANMVRYLMQNGANVNAATSIGYTPLHQTAQQGHCHIVKLLLERNANPNALTANGQTPLNIAHRLGYISVLDSLKSVTNGDEAIQTVAEQKYRVVAPEAMHESFMSDSEDEGGDDNILPEQPYRYLTVDEMKSLGDDSLPIDVTRDERVDSNRMAHSTEFAAGSQQIIEEVTSPYKTHATMKSLLNGSFKPGVDHDEKQYESFLVSFLVDARGGAMRGRRHSGVRMIIPSRCTCQPTRITCRYVKPQRTMHPPQLMEGEALTSRILELGPVSTKFIAPVIVEIPHFASLRGKEREIIILRSDNGETWREHIVDNSEELIHDILHQCFEPEEIAQMEQQGNNHICRFVTYDFPQYFAIVSRIRQEVHAIGPEGGMVSSTVVPQVQAVFPQGALTKKIKVGLQAQPVDPDLTAKLLGRGVAVSPIVTVEPRRRKFHKAITLSMPAPKAHSQGMINQYSGNTPTLRLLCSITGGPSRAQWEDVTGSTPLTFVNDCVSFTTTVSARFWLMDCRNISEATKMATELYKEIIHVPFIAKFVVFAKRVESYEARLRVFCMTDDHEDKTLEKLEYFTEVAKSRDVEVLEGKSQYIEMAGNLVPITKSGEQLHLPFRAFRENRLPFTIRVKDQHADIVGRTLFMKEPKVVKGEPPQHPICILNIVLPEQIFPDSVTSFPEKIATPYGTTYANFSRHQNDHYIGDIRIVDLSNLLGKDWIKLAADIGISSEEIDEIIHQNSDSIARQAQSMIRLYKDKPHYDIYNLEMSLKNIGRDDIMNKCKNRHLSHHSQDLYEANKTNLDSIEKYIHEQTHSVVNIETVAKTIDVNVSDKNISVEDNKNNVPAKYNEDIKDKRGEKLIEDVRNEAELFIDNILHDTLLIITKQKECLTEDAHHPKKSVAVVGLDVEKSPILETECVATLTDGENKSSDDILNIESPIAFNTISTVYHEPSVNLKQSYTNSKEFRTIIANQVKEIEVDKASAQITFSDEIVENLDAFNNTLPTPKPRSIKTSSPTNLSVLDTESSKSNESNLNPIPKPRSQIKPTESFTNLTALETKLAEVEVDQTIEDIGPLSSELTKSIPYDFSTKTSFYIGEPSQIITSTETNFDSRTPHIGLAIESEPTTLLTMLSEERISESLEPSREESLTNLNEQNTKCEIIDNTKEDQDKKNSIVTLEEKEELTKSESPATEDALPFDIDNTMNLESLDDITCNLPKDSAEILIEIKNVPVGIKKIEDINKQVWSKSPETTGSQLKSPETVGSMHPELDTSSTSSSQYKSLETSSSRPLSSDFITQMNSSEYQTAFDKETTEFSSAISKFESGSEKTISSQDSIRSFDSHSDISINSVTIDVSELSETLVESTMEDIDEVTDPFEMTSKDEYKKIWNISNHPITENIIPSSSSSSSALRRSPEMTFKLKSESKQSLVQDGDVETIQTEELQFKEEKSTLLEAEKSKPLSLLSEEDIESVQIENIQSEDMEITKPEENDLFKDFNNLTSDELKYASSFSEGSVLSLSISSTTNVETVIENVPESVDASSLASMTGMSFHDDESEGIPDVSMGGLADITKSPKKNDNKQEIGGEEEGLEIEVESNRYETEYSHQFRSPNDIKIIRKSRALTKIIGETGTISTQLSSESSAADKETTTRELKTVESSAEVAQYLKTQGIVKESKRIQEAPTYISSDTMQSKKLAEEATFQKMVQEEYKQKLAKLQEPDVRDFICDERKAADSPDSFEMVEQPDITDEFIIIEEVAKEANEDEMGGKSIRIKQIKYEKKHDEEVEKIIIKSAPADPKLGSQIYKDDMNFEFEESPPTACSDDSNGGPKEEDGTTKEDATSINRRWVETHLTDNQLRYPYELTGAVLEDIKEEDSELEVGSSRINSFKESYSSTPDGDTLTARRHYPRADPDDVSMSSLQEFESLEQAISLENRNRNYQGSTDSSSGSFTRRYVARHINNNTGHGDDVISISSLKEFEGLENACIEAHLIEIKAKEEAALLSRSDESNNSNSNEDITKGKPITQIAQKALKDQDSPAIPDIYEKPDNRQGDVSTTTITVSTTIERTHHSKQPSTEGTYTETTTTTTTSIHRSQSPKNDQDATAPVENLDAIEKPPTSEESQHDSQMPDVGTSRKKSPTTPSEPSIK